MKTAHSWGMARTAKRSTPFGVWARQSGWKNAALGKQLGCGASYISDLRTGRARPSDLMKAKIIVLTKGVVGLEAWGD